MATKWIAFDLLASWCRLFYHIIIITTTGNNYYGLFPQTEIILFDSVEDWLCLGDQQYCFKLLLCITLQSSVSWILSVLCSINSYWAQTNHLTLNHYTAACSGNELTSFWSHNNINLSSMISFYFLALFLT